MQPFSLTLSGEKIVSGLVSIPSSPPTNTHGYRPLLVLLHGGSYAADYYDADSDKSIEPLSKLLNIPVVSLNRPGYKESTHLPPLSEGQTNHGEQAKALNESILPKIWTEYGVSSGASSIVLAGHSVGAMVAVLTAALHATAQASNTYPLSGLCTSGLANEANPFFKNSGAPQPPVDETGRFVIWPDAARDGMMLMLHEGKADPHFSGTHAKLNNPTPIDEVKESMNMGADAAYKVAAKNVQVPVLALVGEHDALWDMSKAALNQYVDLFEKTTVELGIIQNGPHCLELSYQSRAVHAKVLGHALQSAVGYGFQKAKSSKE